MNSKTSKLLTIITEAVIETMLLTDIESLGITGYTVSNVRGKGGRGVRSSEWDASSNIRIDILCDEATAGAIANHLQSIYHHDYGMTIFLSEVTVLQLE